MSPARPQLEFAAWQVPGSSPVIFYSPVVMDQVAREAVSAFETFPPSGLAVGGVLYGTAHEAEVRITAARQVPCEHLNAPGFHLSESGEESFRRQLEHYAGDDGLLGLVPVGWYLSCTRGEPCLTGQDVDFWNRYFPLPWQVALVLCPIENGPALGGFFFRPASGPIRTESSHLVFEAAPAAPAIAPELEVGDTRTVSNLAQAVRNPPPYFVDDSDPPGAYPAEMAAEEPIPDPPIELFQFPEAHQPGFSVRGWFWPVLGVTVGVAAIAASVFWYSGRAVAKPLPQLGLRFAQSSGQLRAAWDTTSPWVREARRGTLQINTGESSSQIALTQTLIQAGSWPLINQSGDLQVRLELTIPGADPGNGPVFEIARYIGKPAVRESTSLGDLEALQARLSELQAAVSARSKANEKLEAVVTKLRERFTPPDQPEAAQTPPAPKPEPQAPPPRQTASSPSPPPATAPATSLVQPAAPLFPERVQPAPSPLAPPHPAAYMGPGSGKIIWTGFLPANGSLTIAGRRASTGSVNAALPGAPVRVTVYPAEFSSSGLSVYSAAPRHSRGNVEEPRSAQNGWMNTRYVYDPARARQAQVTSEPSASSGFNQIQVRGGDKPLSVLVIEWEVVK